MPDEAEGGLPEQPPEDSPREVLERFFEDIVVDYVLRLEEGRDADIDTYLARYPRYAEDLAFLLSQETSPPPGLVSATPGREGRRARHRRAPHTMGPYELLGHVATTGGSDVYKARNRETGQEVALKIVQKRESIDPRETKRFMREAQMLSEMCLARVVPAYEIDEADGVYYMAMPWIDGETLQDLVMALRGVRRSSLIDPEDFAFEERARIIRRAAETLQTVHDHGVLHRDLKPSNIMIDRDLEPVLIDFGIARNTDYSRVTKTADAPLGTPRYLAPELLLGDAKVADPRSDVYALGMTLYELLVARPAFDAQDRAALFEKILRGGVTPPHEADPRIPERLSRVAMKAIERDPSRRYRSMSALASALGRAIEGRRGGLLSGPWPWVAVAAVVVAAVLALALR